MSFAAELERVTESLAALCRENFGPCGEETLLFQAPEVPLITSEGHAVLAAWKRGLDGNDPVATYLLASADSVYEQLGDASSEFILLINAATRLAAEKLRREQSDWNVVGHTRLSRAFGELKWELKREMETPASELSKLKLPVFIDSSQEFRDACSNILISALRGMLGERAMMFLVDLILQWLSLSSCKTAKLLYQRAQQFIKCAPNAIIFIVAPSICTSNVVPEDEFILKKSIVTSQPLDILDRCRKTVRFACFTCPLSLSSGSNSVELATTTDEELFTAHDAARLFMMSLIRRLRDIYDVQLVITTEVLDESIIAACTRQNIACVQYAEPEHIEALCICAGITPLASVFDDIQVAEHIGKCTNGVNRMKCQQQACLRLRGLSNSRTKCNQKVNDERRFNEIMVPQLLIHAPSKGVYKQYYAAIIKSLRVLRSWWEPGNDCDVNVYSCRGGGATEVAVARWLRGTHQFQSYDQVMFSVARDVLANALIEVVSTLRYNLRGVNASQRGEQSCKKNQRQLLLDGFAQLCHINRETHREEYPGYTLHSRKIQTVAGLISIPEVVNGDPAILGLLHPWRRIDTLLFLVLESLEQVFRIDQVFSKRTKR
ncbi:putative chaperonin Cpn60/TCP-1 family, groEL-like apical domain superfamily [Plasmopara halstedii]